jgi:hypothetical protein
MKINVVEYDPGWIATFQAAKAELEAGLAWDS